MDIQSLPSHVLWMFSAGLSLGSIPIQPQVHLWYAHFRDHITESMFPVFSYIKVFQRERISGLKENNKLINNLSFNQVIAQGCNKLHEMSLIVKCFFFSRKAVFYLKMQWKQLFLFIYLCGS